MDPQKITIELTVDQANVVLAALAKLPFETVADLIVAIRQQAQEQLQGLSTPAVVAEQD